MSKKVTVIGDHGKVAQITTPLLTNDGCEVTSVIRNPDRAPDIEVLGVTPTVYDITSLSTEQFADLLSGHGAVIWPVGAGGGSPERTYTIDRDAAITSIAATEQAGAKHYVMVSYSGVDHDRGVSEDHSFFVYARFKAAAGETLRVSNLEWTILGPSALMLDKGQDSIDITVDKAGEVTRAIAANVIAQIVFDETTVGHTTNFNEGNTPITEALKEQREEVGDGTLNPSLPCPCLCSHRSFSASS